VRSNVAERAAISVTELPSELATHRRPSDTASAAGLSKPYRRPDRTRISRPVVTLISVTASPASLATHRLVPATARAAGSSSP
jgi:hypothetical protein